MLIVEEASPSVVNALKQISAMTFSPSENTVPAGRPIRNPSRPNATSLLLIRTEAPIPLPPRADMYFSRSVSKLMLKPTVFSLPLALRIICRQLVSPWPTTILLTMSVQGSSPSGSTSSVGMIGEPIVPGGLGLVPPQIGSRGSSAAAYRPACTQSALVILSSPHGLVLGAQSVRLDSHSLRNGSSLATRRPTKTQSASLLVPSGFPRGATSPSQPVHEGAALTNTMKLCVALRLGEPLSATDTRIVFVVEA